MTTTVHNINNGKKNTISDYQWYDWKVGVEKLIFLYRSEMNEGMASKDIPLQNLKNIVGVFGNILENTTENKFIRKIINNNKKPIIHLLGWQ